MSSFRAGTFSLVAGAILGRRVPIPPRFNLKSPCLRALLGSALLLSAPTLATAASTTCAATSADQRVTYEAFLVPDAPRGAQPKVEFLKNPVALVNNGSASYNLWGHTTVWKTTGSTDHSVTIDLIEKEQHLDAISQSPGGQAIISMNAAQGADDTLYTGQARAIATYSANEPLFQSFAAPSYAQTYVLGPYTAVRFTLRFEVALELDNLQPVVPGLRPSAIVTAMLAAAGVPTDSQQSPGKRIQPDYSERQFQLSRAHLTGGSQRDRRVFVATITRTVMNESDLTATGYVTAWLSLEAIMNTDREPLSQRSTYDDSESAMAPVRPPTGRPLVLCNSI